MQATILHLPPTIERLQSVNSFCAGLECYTAIHFILLFLNRVLRGQSLQSELVYNSTNMQPMSYRSDFFTCSSIVNSQEPAVWFAVSLLSAVSRVGIPSVLIPTAMSDSKSSITSVLELMMSSKNKRDFIPDLSDRTLQIIFKAWWASMHGGSEPPIASDISGHAPSWWIYSQCRREGNSIPDIICIICHDVLCHPSEHGSSSVGEHLQAKAHIAKLNELTESEVTELTSSMVDETALAILMG